MYHKDGLGSIVAVTDDNGDVLEKYSYEPYGQVTIYNAVGLELNSSAIDNVVLFTGQRHDPETDLYYYKARYYSADKGRFISRDPIGYEDGMNMYAYVGNNPIIFIDVFGTEKHLIYVHGTFVRGDIGDKTKKFLDKIMEDLNISKRQLLMWNPGENNKDARSLAAHNLMIRINHLPESAKIVIVAHSHGGNVLKEVTNNTSLNKKIDLGILLGTPVRDDYTLNRDNINKVANIYDRKDFVQTSGGIDSPMTYACLIRPTICLGSSGREITEDKLYKNFDITMDNKDDAFVDTHGNLHKPGWWKDFYDREGDFFN